MSINQGTEKHDMRQTLGWFPLLTPVQRVFPDPFLRAGDITPSLGKVSLPLLRGVGYGLGPPILLPLQLSDGVCCISSLEAALHETEPFAKELELGGEHVLLLDELL